MVRYNAFQSAGKASWGRFSGLYYYRKQLAYAGVGIGIFYVANLEQAPVTGRYRFMIVPRWLEMKVGEQAYAQTMGQFRPNILPDYHPEARKIKSIMKRIIAVADLPSDIQWKIHVVRGNFPPNAFVLPGGKVFVFESILPICKDDDGLATVLSHETAHQVCRHTAESMSKAPLRWIAAIGLFALTGYGRLDDMFLNVVFELPASRTMEREADYVGVMMMAKACFEPANAVKLWQRMMDMERKDSQYVPELLSTHPASAKRIEDIQKHIPEAELIKQDTCGMASQFFGSNLF